MKMKSLFSAFAISSVLAASAYAESANQVSYPEGYRTWQHIKSMVIQPGHALENPFAGIHHIYANEKAVEGLHDKKYEDGAVLVFDLLEANEGGKAIQEGKRKLVGVMQRDAKKFAKTGGWGFEGFAGDSKTERLTNDGGASCFQCHTSEEKSQYVFTKLRK